MIRVVMVVLAATALAGCIDDRTQAQRDYDFAHTAILSALGPYQPYGEKLILVKVHRGQRNPNAICGYWNQYRTTDGTAYTPFVTFPDSSLTAVVGVGSDWLQNDAKPTLQRQTIAQACGDGLPFSGSKELLEWLDAGR